MVGPCLPPAYLLMCMFACVPCNFCTYGSLHVVISKDVCGLTCAGKCREWLMPDDHDLQEMTGSQTSALYLPHFEDPWIMSLALVFVLSIMRGGYRNGGWPQWTACVKV